jgi:hypothetical protein
VLIIDCDYSRAFSKLHLWILKQVSSGNGD